jgi:glutathione S-transferase
LNFSSSSLRQDDDGFILFESRAICRYIVAKYPDCKLIPTDPRKNALFEQAASIELCNFEFYAGTAVFESRGKPCVPFPPSESSLIRIHDAGARA